MGTSLWAVGSLRCLYVGFCRIPSVGGSWRQLANQQFNSESVAVVTEAASAVVEVGRQSERTGCSVGLDEWTYERLNGSSNSPWAGLFPDASCNTAAETLSRGTCRVCSFAEEVTLDRNWKSSLKEKKQRSDCRIGIKTKTRTDMKYHRVHVCMLLSLLMCRLKLL